MSDSDNNKGGADDLAILYPERTATIAKRVVVMREYTFVESLKHATPIAQLVDAMADIALAGSFQDIDSLRTAFGDQSDAVLQLMAIACDQPLAWVTDLDAAAGEQLMMLWWGVNTDFFLRRVLQSVQLAKLREVQAADGSTSMPFSSPPGTPGNSTATPTVN
ncbi:MAG: DUF6631 family protein [Rhodanobacter sp.]